MVIDRRAQIALLAAITLVVATGGAQTTGRKRDTPVKKSPPVEAVLLDEGRSASLTVMGGAGWPLAKKGLTDFWKYGPSFSATFLTSVNPHIDVGVGVDLTVLRFSYAAFWEQYPDVVPLDRKVIWWDLHLKGEYTLLPYEMITPYATLSLGATRLTPASYKEVVDSVKITYYEIQPRSRLSLGIAVGGELEISPQASFVTEVSAVFVHNDPVAGMLLALRGGFRFAL